MDLSAAVDALIAYQYAALFVGTILFGDTFVLAAGFLAAHGLWHPVAIGVVSLIGTLIADTVWFAMTARIVATETWKRYASHSARVAALVDRLGGAHPYKALLYIKFLYGTRILTVLYLASKRIPYRTFICYDAAGSAILIAALVVIGLAFGAGLLRVLPNLTTTGLLLTGAVTGALLVRFGFAVLRRRFDRR